MQAVQNRLPSIGSEKRLRVLLLPLLATTCVFGQVARRHAGFMPDQLITYCIDDASNINLPPENLNMATEVPGMDGLVLRAGSSAKFELRRYGKILYHFQVADFSNPNGTVVWAPDGKAFAVDYSDGGAIGNFHVRLFSVSGEAVKDVSTAIEPAVNDFKSRHYCKTRGNNVTALKFIRDARHLLLMTDVYPTGDCGPDLGHTEGYVVSVPDGKIQRHLTLQGLKRFPGICLENDSDQ